MTRGASTAVLVYRDGKQVIIEKPKGVGLLAPQLYTTVCECCKEPTHVWMPAGRKRIEGATRVLYVQEAVANIAAFKAGFKYVDVTMADGRSVLIEQSITKLEAMFGARVIRTHRDSLVAIEHMSEAWTEHNDEVEPAHFVKAGPWTVKVSRREWGRVIHYVKERCIEKDQPQRILSLGAPEVQETLRLVYESGKPVKQVKGRAEFKRKKKTRGMILLDKFLRQGVVVSRAQLEQLIALE